MDSVLSGVVLQTHKNHSKSIYFLLLNTYFCLNILEYLF